MSVRTATAASRCRWTQDNQALVHTSDIVILSVRPQDWRGVKISVAGKLIISVMAGISLASIAECTGSTHIVRSTRRCSRIQFGPKMA
ncbi:hypothetical protein BA190_18200 [Labrys sp. WJW]|uniref:pyrroline-5-carboxylate reductase family protein n=1 Tax=Labrys sp. WJW TaxID=1737983 RepID=UPI00082A3023|nr:NAD(P)-binding domain-containing protein [Labrys sp. WJW]OCC03658.1 hypothetical protein BA190_18200 [Labrys sp. WJW]